MHALLFRQWKGRVKGRDWYDWLWLIRKNAKLPLESLAIHMRATGFLKQNEILTRDRFEMLMFNKIAELDLSSTISDIKPFVADSAVIADWSKEMLRHFVSETTSY